MKGGHMKKIKMAAMDFDLTLVDYPPDGSYELSKDAMNLFTKMVGAGMQVGIVSGRDVWPMKDILALARVEWGRPFPSYYICRENYLHYIADGEWVEDAEWNDMIRRMTMSFCRKHADGIPNWLYVLEKADIYSHNWILFSDFGLEIHFRTEEIAERARLILSDMLADDPDISLHRNRMMLNVVPAGTGKGAALLHAAERFGLEPCQVVAFGDSDNDVSMLDGRFGFCGGAVGNASQNVKKAVMKNGGYISELRASHGVHQILSNLVEMGMIDMGSAV